MFDFIKLNISYLEWETLFINPLLNWLPLVDPITGELNPIHRNKFQKVKIRPDYIAEYKGLLFEKHRDAIYLKGSLHYFKNNGKHNWNDYDIRDHSKVISELENSFGICPKKTLIHHIEFGLLINNLSFSSKDVIDNCLVHWCKGAKPKIFKYEAKRKESNFKVVKRKRYNIKIYDKALQFGLNKRSLKLELKYHKMFDLNKLGFSSLSDSFKPEVLAMLKGLLLIKWNEIVFYDWSINTSLLKDRQIIDLKDYRNEKQWIKVSESGKRNEFAKTRNKYNKIVLEKSDQIQVQIATLVIEKWCKLTVSESPNNSSLTVQVNQQYGVNAHQLNLRNALSKYSKI